MNNHHNGKLVLVARVDPKPELPKRFTDRSKYLPHQGKRECARRLKKKA
jgi:hypothetical protein